MVSSSSRVHLSLEISGLRWLCHLSLHCLPIRPGNCLAMKLQFLAPCSATSCVTSSSSYVVFVWNKSTQGPLTRAGFRTFCHLCRHCTSVRSPSIEAIFFQFLAPYSDTRSFRRSSSSIVQYCFCAFVEERDPSNLF